MAIRLIHGGPAHARRTFRREGRGYWSAALGLVLEKHGLLDVEEAGPEVLAAPGALAEPGVTVIARLPEEAWSDALVAAVAGASAPVIVEGPLPEALATALGLGPAAPLAGELRLRPLDSGLAELAAPYGAPPGGFLGTPSSRFVERPAALEWSALPEVPLTAAQAEAWAAPGWDLAAWTETGDADVLAVLDPVGGGTGGGPAIVRAGSVVACSFGLLGFLGQAHTSPPFPRGRHLASHRTTGVETLLLALLDRAHAEAGLSRARVLPWPEGVDWVLNVRHDFDRPLRPSVVRGVLDRHRAAGTVATWYWRACHLEGRRAAEAARAVRQVVLDPAHELALHADRLWTGDLERQRLEVAAGTRVAGASAHGNPVSTRFQGAPNVLWAEREALAYTELIQHAHRHPHRFAALGPDGEIAPLRVLALPHHESFDISSRGGDVGPDRLDGLAESWSAAGGLAQVLNHPDINLDPLFAALAALPRDGRADWTAAEAVDWWGRTHVAGGLAVEREDAGAFTVRSPRGVDGAVIELRAPDGRRTTHVVRLGPGEATRVGQGPAVPRPAGPAGPPALPGGVDARAAAARRRWDRDLSPLVAEGIRDWHIARGLDPDSGAARSTVRTNTELVPGRWRDLMRMLDGGPGSALAGRRVLEAGAGFGALAAYGALAAGPSVVAVEHQADFLPIGRRIAAALPGEVTLRFEHADLRALDGLDDGIFDLVVANNTLLYLREREDLRTALRELHRVLAPGGRILVHQANLLRPRDPFTGSLLSHLLPPGLSGGLGPSSRDRVLLLSPAALRRELGRTGFADATSGAILHDRVTSGASHHGAKFVFARARRPG